MDSRSLNLGARCLHLALFFASLAAASPNSASAQTIAPVRSEYRVEADGEFRLVNDSFTPLYVVLEPQSFEVSENGEIKYGQLAPSIHVKFSATSFRIQPKQTYTVGYKAKADKLPAWFVIYAKFSGLPVRTASGMNVSINLPHTVYILPKKDADRSELKVIQAEFNPVAKKVFLETKSNSERFARVLSSQLEGSKKKIDGPGFPMFPGGTRRIEIDWPENEPPVRATLIFENYKIEAPIQQKR
jgi:hypothetical protein